MTSSQRSSNIKNGSGGGAVFYILNKLSLAFRIFAVIIAVLNFCGMINGEMAKLFDLESMWSRYVFCF